MLIDESALRELVRREVAGVIEDLVLPALGDSAPSELLRLSRVQHYLDCGWDLVDRLIRTGELDAVQVGRDRRVTRASLAAYIARHRLDQPGAPELRAVGT